ncbi:MAG: glucose 1-dehydrogenase [Candidatus Symbiothrix sp.]|jgi:NAD(P)-dependent dehydrogenase (short-subunit alcohol dehydrogenase family)|nr:glucose 1-dehydrogenase [Candidatus Symbiothrix sp.]
MVEINLKGKKALVTGGAQGIGAEICKTLASCGADVFINYRSSKEKAERLAEELKTVYGVNAWAIRADISKSDEVKEMFGQLDACMGTINILINNAGVESCHHVLDLEESEWDKIFNTDLKGAFLCSQEAGRRMVENNSGVIINISSIHDTVPRKGLTHYCSAKGGLKMFSKCLALELAENNIRVISVSPGAIETEMNKEEIAAFGVEKFNHWIPAGRIGNVNEVAPVIAFLCSDMASYITGTELYIDGAYLLSTIQYDPRPQRNK